MNNSFQIAKNIRDIPPLRRSFNELAMQSWGFDFEDWYENGYWSDSYIPYSMVHENKVVANVSVNLMHFVENGIERRFIQLGTVMTAPEYRLQGLCRKLMEEIEKDYGTGVGAFYLFANDSVLDFYPKFGYHRADEYEYSRPVSPSHNDMQAVRLPMQTDADRAVLEQAIIGSAVCGDFDMRNNVGLFLFYVTKFMQNDVYYIPSLDACVIAELEEDVLLLHHIFSPVPVDPLKAAQAFGGQVRRLVLGFTPADRDAYECSLLREEDTTLFIKGNGLKVYENGRNRFPSLSRA